jgi:hypothetical protein
VARCGGRFVAVLLAGLLLIQPVSVSAQSMLQAKLLGGWVLTSEILVLPGGKRIASWGDHPYGFLNFDASGHFSQMLIRSDLPKFTVRNGGTAEQNDAVAKGSIAYYGTYGVDDGARAVDLHITGSSFATFNGTDSRRMIAFSGADEIKTTNKIPWSEVTAELVWTRAR